MGSGYCVEGTWDVSINGWYPLATLTVYDAGTIENERWSGENVLQKNDQTRRAR